MPSLRWVQHFPSRNRLSRLAAKRALKGTAMNITILRGVVATDASHTDRADGRGVHNFEFRTAESVVPAAWYDARRPPRLAAGDEMVVVGQVRRRWFRAGGGSQSRTEVVAGMLAKAGSSRAEKAVLAAAERCCVDESASQRWGCTTSGGGWLW